MDDWEIYFSEKSRRRARRKTKDVLGYAMMGLFGLVAILLAMACTEALFSGASTILSDVQKRLTK